MENVQFHLYTNLQDFEKMLNFTQNIWTPRCQFHIGDLAWGRFQHVNKERDWVTAIWEIDNVVAGWGWIELPSYLNFCVDPKYTEIADLILEWFGDTAADNELTTMVLNGETHLITSLQKAGYHSIPGKPFFTHMSHSLTNLAEPQIPVGFRVRPIHGEEDLTKRVEVHRAAWNPSKVTEESYANVMKTTPYIERFDWIVENEMGEFVSYCLIWFDDYNGVGLLEPIGTHPDYRQLGLARAVCLSALHELKKAGAKSAIVKPRGDDAYPLPAKFYKSLGFESYDNTKVFSKTK